MKVCPECHKMSKTDDFCSYCGAAVYGDEDVGTDIRCTLVKGHEHQGQEIEKPKKNNTFLFYFVLGFVLPLLLSLVVAFFIGL